MFPQRKNSLNVQGKNMSISLENAEYSRCPSVLFFPRVTAVRTPSFIHPYVSHSLSSSLDGELDCSRKEGEKHFA